MKRLGRILRKLGWPCVAITLWCLALEEILGVKWFIAAGVVCGLAAAVFTAVDLVKIWREERA